VQNGLFKTNSTGVLVISERARLLAIGNMARYRKSTLLGKARLIEYGWQSTIKNASANSKDD
jgi:hypothetical protein